MIKDIDIGREIEAQLNRLNLNKSEFSRRVGMPSQNVNRLLESRNIYTDKLVRVSEALDYNFFRLWVDDEPTTIKAESSAVSTGSGSATLNYNSQPGTMVDNTSEVERLRTENEMLKRTIADKQMIIDLLINKNK